jgi:hypothetical protein
MKVCTTSIQYSESCTFIVSVAFVQIYGGEPYSERYVIPSMKGELPNEVSLLLGVTAIDRYRDFWTNRALLFGLSCEQAKDVSSYTIERRDDTTLWLLNSTSPIIILQKQVEWSELQSIFSDTLNHVALMLTFLHLSFRVLSS